MDAEKALGWLEHFDQTSRKHQEGAYRMLLLDGHASHTSPEFIQACEDRCIIPFCLPPHSTHLLQPLDVCVFQPYKHYYAIVTERGVRSGVYNWGKDDFLAAQPEIKKLAFKKATIKSAFKHTGIWPLNAKMVLQKIKDWCEEDFTLTPEQEVRTWWKDFVPIDPYEPRGTINGIQIPPKTAAEIKSDLAFNIRELARREAKKKAAESSIVEGEIQPATPPPNIWEQEL